MLDKLATIEEKYLDLESKLMDPKIIGDQALYRRYAKEQASLSEVVSAYRDYRSLLKEIEEVRSMVDETGQDNEIREMAKEEMKTLEGRKAKMEIVIKQLLTPTDPNDGKNVILEIRAGAGGEEAALFAADLSRMYMRYAEAKGWRVEMLSQSTTGIGGIKEIIMLLEGKGVYSRLKFESGVHRVQRVPTTESGGRIHTSTVTVAVLPEAEEVDVDIDPEDLRVDVFRSSGPGGQSVNTTDSAVRITHQPTGIVVSCQDEKSQHKNKSKAMRILRARLLDMLQKEQESKIAAERRSMVGTGDRSERIRTYNFPQNRVTDHRVNLTVHRLESVLEGEIDQFIEALTTDYQTKLLKDQGPD